ncbi:MAG: sensor histidine kinase [Spirochaetales bacterium]|nr:sensor histidine kinase [Spirochaetales bacterium]
MKSPLRSYLFHRMIFISAIYLLIQVVTMFLLFSGSGSGSAAFLLLGGIGIFFLMVFLFLYRPFRKMEKRIDDYVYGYSGELLPEEGVSVSESLDRLLAKIREDLRTEKLLRNSDRQAEYLALQNQINPHFLYNTLEGIRSDALSEGVDNIASIIESLAVYFRYTISKVDRLVTLEEELANLNNYLAIQNYRFGGKISLVEVFDQCDRSVCSHLIPKLILQPFMENAIIHGLEEKVGPGVVKIIFSHTEDRLLLTIEDDGVGIGEDKLWNINASLSTVSGTAEADRSGAGGGIAIKNVNNRIKLLFGERFGIRLRSMKNIGTSVDISLPLLSRGENRDGDP